MKFCKLSELCTEIIDCPHSTPEWKTHGVRVVRNFNLSRGILDFTDGYFVDEQTYEERTKRAVPQPGDIIISREAPVGAAAIVPEGLKCCLGQRLVLLRADSSKCSPEYLLFALLSECVQTQFRRADATGSIVSGIGIKDLKEILVPINEKPLDKEVQLLTSVNKKISLNSELCITLQRQLSLIYDLWFTRFDFPDGQGRPYRSSGGKMEYNSLLKREIPVGWTAANLLELVSWNGGSQPPKSQHISEYKPGYVRFIQNRDYADSSHMTFIPESRSNKLCNEYDIMLDKYGAAGTTRFGIAGAYNVALSRIDVRGGYLQEYIRSFLSSGAVKQYLSGSSMASTRASLNEGNLSFIDLAVPPGDILEKYERLAKMFVRRILLLREECRELAGLQDRLIPAIISGQAEITE